MAGGHLGRVTRRERKARTRARIETAAASQFSERGYSGTSLQSIASQAGVSYGSLSWHFGNKAALYVHVLQEAGRRLIAAMEPHVELKSMSFRGLLDEWVRVLAGRPEICGLLLAATTDVRLAAPDVPAHVLLSESLVDFWAATIAKLAADGQPAFAGATDELARLIVAASYGLLAVGQEPDIVTALAPLQDLSALGEVPVGQSAAMGLVP